ncbi:MAG: type II toxin-antitoxin system death-on-curing family toxin [Ktedonobacterales bacterium]|nr:type II toxin-antitoxin system death-on-curing family toxin [Ktedonobacterales bacterium]
MLIDGIAQAHAFIDGNKRTATAAGLIFLRLNGYTIQYVADPDNNELGQQVLDLVKHQLTVGEFAAWLRSRLITIP